MEKTQYSILMRVAIVLTIAWISWSLYDGAFRERSDGESAYHAANKFFEDELYEDALTSYREALTKNPELINAKRGIARSLMQLEQFDNALVEFNIAIKQEPDFGASYANRGILYDRMGSYEEAIADYQKAIQLDPKLAEGPSWLTRFLRNQAKKPPTILDRMKYLQTELKKPEDQRVLQLPNKDEQQKPYKL